MQDPVLALNARTTPPRARVTHMHRQKPGLALTLLCNRLFYGRTMIERVFPKNFARNYEKRKIILGPL